MRIENGLAWAAALAIVAGEFGAHAVQAQGTKLWSISRYEDMEHGTAKGVAIRSDGELQPGPATQSLYVTGGNLVWSVAADSAGNAYIGQGGTGSGGAVVTRVSRDGKATKVFDGKELGVQALRVGGDGKVYAATSPDGKVYRLGSGPEDATVVFDPAQTAEKPKYLWDIAQGKSGDLWVATGAPAVVYHVSAGAGKPEVAFKTADQHIRCLLLAPDGTLWAGSDGSGVVYRFNTKTPGATPFAAYAAAKREITSLAMDGSGNVYAAAVGQKTGAGSTTAPGLPPLPVTGAMNVTVTFSQPGSASATNTNTLIPEGSEIYRIAPDGTPERLLALKDDVVYALVFHKGSLLAATGNRGRVYRVDTAAAGRFTDVTHLEAAEGMAFAEVPEGVLVATSNSGKLYRLDDKPAPNATYTSEVFDAHVFSKWGRVEVAPEDMAGADLFVRTGNVESPLMGWSEWQPVSKAGAVTVPPARFVQWKAELHGGATVESVALNYLEKNIAPVVDDIAVQPGARVQPSTGVAASSTVQISFTSPSSGSSGLNLSPESSTQSLTAQKDRTAVTVRWAAHDDNGDDLMYAVWYRGVGEKNWRLLKDNVSDKYLSFDASLLPDGKYEAKVVASDAPDHTDADTLTGDKVSDQFVVDTTPPVPGTLSGTLVPGTPVKIHVTFEAKDSASPIAHAEYSVDAGPWQYVEPIGKLSDSLKEKYDFTAEIPTSNGATPVSDSHEHVIAVRVYDRNENVVSAKAVVR